VGDLVAVYEGVLRKVSEGNVISSEGRGGYYVERFGVTRYRKGVVDDQAGWTRRQFVDIGETRIRNVMLMPYHDALLQEAVGEEVALSMTGPEANSPKRHTVLAIRTPKGGVNKPTGKHLWVGAIMNTLRCWFGAVILTAILSFVLLIVAGLIAAFLFDSSVPAFVVGLVVGGVVALAVLIVLMAAPIVDATRAFRAASALDEKPSSAVPTMIS
jgi:hypothetical protein